MDRIFLYFAIFSLLFFPLITEVQSASFRFVNRCRHTIWPGLLSGATSPQLPTTGFTLNPQKSKTLTIPKSWSGRIWARTLCSIDHTTNKFTCLTADCGSGKVQCAGSGATPPATLAEFTLNGDGGLDFYDVSLVDGYNLPILVVAKRGGNGGDCSATGCLVDINGGCPSELKVATMRGNSSGYRGVVACKSACEAFGDPRYCCSEGYNTPETCPPSVYSSFFKHVCPRAYSYAYDDKTSTFTCSAADYDVIFCPPPYTRTHFGVQSSDNGGRRGGWITFPFIIGTVLGLTISGSGWLTNMTVYLIDKYHIKNVDATQISNIIYACSNLIPLLGAIAADSMFSCFSVILFSAVGSLLGTLLLFFTAVLPALRPRPCDPGSSACETPGCTQYATLYLGIIFGCIGIGGTRFTIATMGANQFKLAKDQETFFNWYFFGLYLSAVVGNTVILYVEDSVSWAWGFGICVALNLVGISIFLMGNRYFHNDELHGSPFTSLARVVVASVSKMRIPLSSEDEDYYYGDNGIGGESGLKPTKGFRFLNRAALIIKRDAQAESPKTNPWKLCTVKQVEDLKSILRIFPIWSTAVVICTILSINNSFAVLQALVTDRDLTSNFKIPAGSMLVFVLLSAAISLPIIDRLIYPGYKRLANRYPTPLQRIGMGHIINVFAMALSAVVESKRLHSVKAQSLLKKPDMVVPMSALWFVSAWDLQVSVKDRRNDKKKKEKKTGGILPHAS